MKIGKGVLHNGYQFTKVNPMSLTYRSVCHVFVAVSWLVCLGTLGGATSDAATVSDEHLVQEIIKQTGLDRGLCVVLGAKGDLPLDLARESQALVYVRDPDAAAVAALHKQALAAGLPIQRLVVERGACNKLPFADNVVDLVIDNTQDRKDLKAPSQEEMLRALRPEGATVRKDADGTLVTVSKPPPAGVDDWSHWEKAPDNNPVSDDQIIRAPYMTQFLAGPMYIGMPSVTTAAGGRTFLAIGHIAHHRREWPSLQRLIARNGYNGIILWERKLPKDYLAHRSAFVATKDTFYMVDGRVLCFSSA